MGAGTEELALSGGTWGQSGSEAGRQLLLLLVLQRELQAAPTPPLPGAPHSAQRLRETNQATQRLPANFPLSTRQQLPALWGVLVDPTQGTQN